MVGETHSQEVDNSDTRGCAKPGGRFFHESAPKETMIERLDRYIAYCKERRPKGLIEIVLATGAGPTVDQTVIWGPIIEERGFKEVVRNKNSNSGNTCVVYYLAYGE
jgi:hypothetical protein